MKYPTIMAGYFHFGDFAALCNAGQDLNFCHFERSSLQDVRNLAVRICVSPTMNDGLPIRGFSISMMLSSVFPAEAGIQFFDSNHTTEKRWIPAFAGKTNKTWDDIKYLGR
jgi:hypothetical protein